VPFRVEGSNQNASPVICRESVQVNDAGEVTAAEVVKDRKSGESQGFAFVTMNAQNEAYKADSMFKTYSLGEHVLKVSLAKPREERGTTNPTFEL